MSLGRMSSRNSMPTCRQSAMRISCGRTMFFRTRISPRRPPSFFWTSSASRSCDSVSDVWRSSSSPSFGDLFKFSAVPERMPMATPTASLPLILAGSARERVSFGGLVVVRSAARPDGGRLVGLVFHDLLHVRKVADHLVAVVPHRVVASGVLLEELVALEELLVEERPDGLVLTDDLGRDEHHEIGLRDRGLLRLE